MVPPPHFLLSTRFFLDLMFSIVQRLFRIIEVKISGDKSSPEDIIYGFVSKLSLGLMDDS